MDPYYYSNCICKIIYEVLGKSGGGGGERNRGVFRNGDFKRKMAAGGCI